MCSESEADMVRTAAVELENDFAELSRLTQATREVFAPVPVSDETLFKIDLVLEELATNVIKYGFTDSDKHLMRFEFRLTGQEAEIKLIDDGMPFDPFAGPEKQLPSSLDQAEVGGLGMHLVKLYTDAYRYERQQDKNVITLVFKL